MCRAEIEGVIDIVQIRKSTMLEVTNGASNSVFDCMFVCLLTGCKLKFILILKNQNFKKLNSKLHYFAFIANEMNGVVSNL